MPRLALLVAAFALLAAGCADGPPADLVLKGGRIVTLDDTGPAGATAVALRGGLIVAVGSDAEAMALRGPQTGVIDLEGAVVVPGLVDSHMHLMGLGKALAEVDLVGAESADDCAARVAAHLASVPDDGGAGWIQGRGWDQNDWFGRAWPERSTLDAVTAGRPCLLRRVDGHAAWANSEALRLAGVTAATPDPDGGQILRDAAGKPTGILVDNAVDLVRDVIPAPSLPQKAAWLERAVEHCVAHGLTAVHDAGVSWETAGVVRDMAVRRGPAGGLRLRWYGMVEDEPASLDSAFTAGPILDEHGLVTLRAVKLYADGALGSRGALLLEDYNDRPGHRGLAVTPEAHLEAVARRAADAGFQVGAHAIGDAANRLVLDIYERVFAELVPADRRWRVEHAQILDPADIPRFAELGVIAAMQPVHCTSDMDWADERLGADRLAGAYAWRSLLDAGAHVCGGTDAPVEAVDPLAGLYAARTRQHPDGTPIGGWQPHQKLDGVTALRLATTEGAYAAFAEHQRGMVRTGFQADLTVLDGDPTTCPAEDLLSMGVVMTVVDGRIAWSSRPTTAGPW
jgi:predicted amidohydrolase YtcJ